MPKRLISLGERKKRIFDMSIKASSSMSIDAEGLRVQVLVTKEPYPHIYVTRFVSDRNGCKGFIKENSCSKDRNIETFFEGSTPLREIARHVDDWARVAGSGFKRIVVNIPGWYFGNTSEPEFNRKIHSCKRLEVYSDDEKALTFWLQRINEGPYELYMRPEHHLENRRCNPFGDMSREFAQLNVWTSPGLRELTLMHWVPFTDEELLQFRIKSFEIMSKTISDNGLNQYLHKWASLELREVQRFGISLNRPIDIDAVLRGLLVYKWDDEFRNSLPATLKQRERCYEEIAYTVFRHIPEDDSEKEEDFQCSNATVYFYRDNSCYLELDKWNWEIEDFLNANIREKATMP